jgi:predicted Rossmann-fold nucleotide-binding protein
MQTRKTRPTPMVLAGSRYWGGLVDWMREHMLAEGRLTEADFELFRVADEAGEIVERATGGLPNLPAGLA